MTTEELKKIGVNPDNLVCKDGSKNIIVHCYEVDDELVEDNNLKVYPDIYQPERNEVYSCAEYMDGYDLNDEKQKKEYMNMLKDSIERLKIMSYLLSKQLEEIEEFGYPKTRCVFPE